MNIEINLKEDFINLLKLEMDTFGIKYSKSKDIEYQYLNYSRKRKIPTVNKVYNTPKIFAFYKYKDKIDEIIRALENNIDLSYRLSLLSMDSKKRDKMLDFFNIYHFHLGDKPHKKKASFIERTDELLFIYFYEDKAYILGIFPHPEEWLANNWFQIVYNNWPEVCANFELNGIVGNENFSREEIVKLRKSSINTSVYLNGKAYIPLNFGVTTSGARMEDTMLIDKTHIILEHLENILTNNLDVHLTKYLDKTKLIDFFKSKDNIKINIKSLQDYSLVLVIKNSIMNIEITYVDILK